MAQLQGIVRPSLPALSCLLGGDPQVDVDDRAWEHPESESSTGWCSAECAGPHAERRSAALTQLEAGCYLGGRKPFSIARDLVGLLCTDGLDGGGKFPAAAFLPAWSM